jgi:catechol 2,3-dioxygenase-like lactoylglutathione lyase family enzyme
MDWKLEVVVLPVTDVDRAKHFYSEQIGFHVDVDRTFSESFRVVQMTPPGSACSVAIGPVRANQVAPPQTQLQLVVADIAAARSELVARGVDVTPIQHFEDGVAIDGKGDAWNSFIFFSDPDGNNWSVQERPDNG